MRSELKPRAMRSRIAKPLLTSLSTVTMLAASSFVLLAVSSTGSAKPWDWTRMDPSAAFSRCGQQGLGAVGCMLSAGFRPAAAAGGGAHRAQQPLFSVATVQDQPPADAPATREPSRTAPARGTRTGTPPAQHVVKMPANATTAEMLAACQAAMKTAQAQGAAAMKEVETECEADLEPSCPAAAKPSTASGPAVIDELENECRAPATTAPTGWHDD